MEKRLPEKSKTKIFKNKWVRLSAALLLFAAYAITLSLTLGTACVIKLATGLPCPGCGLTRANLAALRLDFTAAFKIHPLFFYSVIFAGLLVLGTWKPHLVRKRLFSMTCVILCVVLVAVFIVRMIYVAPEPPLDTTENSLLGIIVRWIQSWFT